MTRDELTTHLRSILGDAASKFVDADLHGFLSTAADALSRRLQPTNTATVQLVSGEASYPAPPDMIGTIETLWGRCPSPAWSSDYTGPAPRWWRGHGIDGSRLCCAPPPTDDQIARYGATMSYRYGAAWRVTSQDVTVPDTLRELLILRALPEALRVLAVSGTVKPIQMHKGVGSTGLMSVAASGTPQALHDQFMALFETECDRLAR